MIYPETKFLSSCDLGNPNMLSTAQYKIGAGIEQNISGTTRCINIGCYMTNKKEKKKRKKKKKKTCYTPQPYHHYQFFVYQS